MPSLLGYGTDRAVNPMEKLAVGTRVIGIVMEMQNVVNYLQTHDKLTEKSAELYVNAYMVTMCQYAVKTLEILKHDEVQPLLGKRCMFY